MPTVTNGVIQALSVSQVEKFDPAQTGGCPRRWWFEYPQGHRVESGPAQEDGDAGHALLALWYRFGDVLPKRARMLKAVRGAIAAGHLPPPEPGQLVESRFDGQPARDANGQRLPLRKETTLWLGGVPWDGYVDLRFYRDGVVTVLDHKFSSDIHEHAKPAEELVNTIQMPVYALDSVRLWPDAKAFRLGHHYVSRRGVDSFIRWQTVTEDQINERAAQVDLLVQRMQLAARVTNQDDVPFNRKSCMTYSGCPHQSRCNAFRRNQSMALELTPEELALFGMPAPQIQEQKTAELMRLVEEEDEEPPDLQSQRVEEAARHASELERASGAPDVDIPLPTASTPAPQPEGCRKCGETLTPENSSKLQDGRREHIGCPADVVTAPPATGPKCTDCPHPAHPGQPCTGKRGRGACRCGQAATPAGADGVQATLTRAAAESIVRGDAPVGVPGAYTARIPLGAEPIVAESVMRRSAHLSTCVQSDGGKWLCMDGCTASRPGDAVSVGYVAGKDESGALSIPEAVQKRLERATQRVSEADPNPPSNFNREMPGVMQGVEDDARGAPYPTATGAIFGPVTGSFTVRVAVQVGLTPDTIAVLERLFKR